MPLFFITFLSLLAFASCEELILVSDNGFERMKQDLKVGTNSFINFTDQPLVIAFRF